MSTIEIQPAAAPFNARIRPPGSKSLTNRALVCASLAGGTSTLHGVLQSEDTEVMIEALRALGLTIRVNHKTHLAEVNGCGCAIPASKADLYVANSGTTVRFLTALVSLGHGTFRLHGTPRMHERPIADLLDTLKQLGIRAESEAGDGCPPVVVHAAGLKPGKATIRGNVSSQFLSGLLMAAPCAATKSSAPPLEIEIDGPLVSKPYVEMTLAVMRAFGARVEVDRDWRKFEIAPTGYVSQRYDIEPDASAASYFWAAAAITGGRVLVEGLGNDSVQGDVAFLKCLARMGCKLHEDESGTTVEGGPLEGIDVDMNAISTSAPMRRQRSGFRESASCVRS